MLIMLQSQCKKFIIYYRVAQKQFLIVEGKMLKLKSHKNTIAAGFIGYITQAIASSFAPLLFITFQTEFAISLSQISILMTATFGTQLIMDILGAKLVDKIGYRTCIVAAHIISAIGFIGLGTFPNLFSNPFAGLVTAIVIYAIGSGIIEVMVSPIVESCPTKNKEASMSYLHSAYSWGVLATILISTLFFVTVGIKNWRLLACLFAIIPFANALYFLFVPLYPIVNDAQGGLNLKQLFSRKIFWLMAAMMLCAGASELAITQWASAFAEAGLNIPKATADLLAPCGFALTMGTARVLYAKFSKKIKLSKALLASAIMCVLCYVIIVFSPWAWLSLIGCALCGFAVGILWPGVVSTASKRCPRGGTAMFALLALAGDVGCLSAPVLVGIVSDAAGGEIKWGIASAVIFPLLLVVGAIILLHGKKKYTPLFQPLDASTCGCVKSTSLSTKKQFILKKDNNSVLRKTKVNPIKKNTSQAKADEVNLSK